MNSFTRSTRSLLRRTGAGFCFSLSVMAGMAAVPATVPGTYGTMVVGDVSGLIDQVGELAGKVSPGISGTLIKTQLGQFLGDPGLTNFPAGCGLAVAFTESGNGFLLLETAEGKAEAVAETATQRGGKAEAVSGKLVAIASDAASLEAAKGEAGKAVAASLAGNDDKFLMITIDADKLFKDKEADIKKGINQGLEQAKAKSGKDDPNADKAAKFITNLLGAVAKRTDVAQVKIDISGNGVRFEKLVYPVGGLNPGTSEGPTGAELMKAVPVTGTPMGLYQSYLDTQWAVKGLSEILSESLEGTDIEPAEKEKIMKMVTDAGAAYGDGMAGYSSLDENGKMDAAYLISVTDEAKALQYYEDSLGLSENSAIKSFYDSLGMVTTTTLTKDAGKVGDKSYNAFKMEIGMPKGSGKDQSMEGKYMVVDNKMVVTMGSVSIDELANAAKAGSAATARTLKSASALEPGAAIYMDYDAGSFGKLAAQGNKQVGDVLESLSGTPIQEALYVNNENIRFVFHIPSELIVKAVSGFTGMKSGAAAPSAPSSNE